MKNWLKKLLSTNTVVISGSVVMGDVVVSKSRVSGDLFNSNDLKNLGEVISQNRDVSPFDKINITGAIDVQFNQGESLSLIVEAQEGVLSKIETTVENGMLTISTKGNFVSTQKSLIKVTSPSLTLVKHSGVGTFKAFGINEESFKLVSSATGNITLEGSVETVFFETSGVGKVNANFVTTTMNLKSSSVGNITLEGKAETAFFNTDGVGKLNAKDFIVKTMNLNSGGVGNVSVQATETISGIIKGIGNINVYGNPRNAGLKSKGIGKLNFH